MGDWFGEFNQAGLLISEYFFYPHVTGRYRGVQDSATLSLNQACANFFSDSNHVRLENFMAYSSQKSA